MIRDHGHEPGKVEQVMMGVGFAAWLATTIYHAIAGLLG